MSFMSRLWGSTSPIPFISDHETPLLQFGDEAWTLEDASRATLDTGSSGSGKTSGSGAYLMRAIMRTGAGFLVPCVKSNLASEVEKIARECGRERDVIRFSADSPWRFNFLEYSKAVSPDGFDVNLGEALVAAADAAQISNSAQGGGDNPFFRQMAEQAAMSVLPFLKETEPQIELRDMMRFLDSAPTAPEQVKDPDWLKTSFCAQTLKRCGDLAKQGNAEAARIAEEYGAFWLQRWPQMGDRTRSSVVATLTSTIKGLLSGKLHEIFCTSTNLVPEMTHEGAIIILDFSEHEYGATGLIAQQIFKTLWMRSITQREITKGMRKICLWVDEAQALVSPIDAIFLSVSREYGALPVYLTQDMEALKASMGGENAEARVNQFIAKFGTLIMHSNGCPTTNNHGAQLIGKVTKYRMTNSVTGGTNTSKGDETGLHAGGGTNRGWSRNYTTYEDYDVPPEYFANKLRTGGKANRLLVDAILIRSARPWKSSGTNRLKVTFHQKVR